MGMGSYIMARYTNRINPHIGTQLMNTLILTLLLMTTSHPYELSPICTKSATYIEGPYRGLKGGCYCLNPKKRKKKKYIDRRHCNEK